jgi:hypothetical protein
MAAMALGDCGRAAISLLLAPQPAPCAARLLFSASGSGGAVRAEAALTYAAACDYDALCGGGRVVDLLRVRAAATPHCDLAACVDPAAAPDPAVVLVTPTCGSEQGGTIVEVRCRRVRTRTRRSLPPRPPRIPPPAPIAPPPRPRGPSGPLPRPRLRHRHPRPAPRACRPRAPISPAVNFGGRFWPAISVGPASRFDRPSHMPGRQSDIRPPAKGLTASQSQIF